MNDIELLYIDLFCGAGGTSTGVNSARLDGRQCAQVVACVNHDKNAIASHAANHPEAMHFTEDIRTLELSPLLAHLQSCRKQNPDALVVLWASLECTNFSKAKGGMPRDADSRTLAEHLFRYIVTKGVELYRFFGDVVVSTISGTHQLHQPIPVHPKRKQRNFANGSMQSTSTIMSQ